MYGYTSLLDLALLSKKVYGGFKDSDIPEGLVNPSKLWVPIPETSYNASLLQDTGHERNGFYACVYENFATNERVLAIKGTLASLSHPSDILSDLNYGITDILNNRFDMAEYKELNKYMFYLSSIFGGSYYNEQNKENDYFNIKYVCGHSLGGIMAKMIACQLNLDGVAFNSPSVKNVIKQYNILADYKSIRTVYCKNDPVTNLDCDLLGEKYILDAGYSIDDKEKVDFTHIREKVKEQVFEHNEKVDIMNKYSRGAARSSLGAGYSIGDAAGRGFDAAYHGKLFDGHSNDAINTEFNYQHGIKTVIKIMNSIQKYRLPVKIC